MHRKASGSECCHGRDHRANILPCAAILNKYCRKKHSDGRLTEYKGVQAKSQFVMWFAGLRGPVAYGLAKKWREESTDERFKHIVSTTMLLVVITTFFCGGLFAKLIEKLGLEVKEEEELDTPWLGTVGFREDALRNTIATSPRKRSKTLDADGVPSPTTQGYDYVTQQNVVELPSSVSPACAAIEGRSIDARCRQVGS